MNFLPPCCKTLSFAVRHGCHFLFPHTNKPRPFHQLMISRLYFHFGNRMLLHMSRNRCLPSLSSRQPLYQYHTVVRLCHIHRVHGQLAGHDTRCVARVGLRQLRRFRRRRKTRSLPCCIRKCSQRTNSTELNSSPRDESRVEH